MSAQRDELAAEIADVYLSNMGAGPLAGKVTQFDLAEAILAAGYRKPRVITDLVELDALDFGSIIHMKNVKAPFLLTDEGWESTSFPGKPVWDYTSNPDYLPATVLYEPTA